MAPRQVSDAVFDALLSLKPSAVFAPAPAFAEGAGALHYKVRHGGRLVLMDDAWSATDQRGRLTRWVKRIFYAHVDGGFFPDRLHGDYFAGLNIPLARQRYPVDVVGPIPAGSDPIENAAGANSEPYVLFVGRLIPRKGLEVLLRAMACSATSLRLVIIGEGPERATLQALAAELGLESRIRWLGQCSNTEARAWMAKALALLVPSEFEQWGLVVNEAWMAPTLALGSDTVGALKANYTNEMNWMMVPAGDVVGWQGAMARLQALTADERAGLLNESRRLAEKYSLAAHTQGVLELLNLPPRSRPMALAGWLAHAWHGRVAVW
jgi:glycosyltransferase involved in cell wall biosynthesis